jgi:hypothetical protein
MYNRQTVSRILPFSSKGVHGEQNDGVPVTT